jgi:Xaa-Pro aminopeptidase
MEKLNPDTMAVLFCAPTRTYSREIEYPYRQDSNLYYLTGLEQDETTLVLLPGNTEHREILFTRSRDPVREHWRGKILSKEEAGALSGITTVLTASEFEPFMNAVLSGKPHADLQEGFQGFFGALDGRRAIVALVLDPDTGSPDSRSPAQVLAGRIETQFPSVKVEDATNALRDLRQLKSKYEQGRLRESVRIACEAQIAGMKAAHPGCHEYEVAAAIMQVFTSRGADGWAYPPVVGSGPNTTILHYDRYSRTMQDGDLLLTDAGASYAYLAGDITRTYPVNGTFSRLQRDIYQVVLAAEEAGTRAAKPGARFTDINESVVEVIKDGLYRLGLITDKSGDQYRAWTTHGACHFIGIDVHDVGDARRPLAAGMAFAIEPGIYIRMDGLERLPRSEGNEAFVAKVRPLVAKYGDMGVRIEDSFLMIESGPECLSESVPRTVEGIEALLK